MKISIILILSSTKYLKINNIIVLLVPRGLCICCNMQIRESQRNLHSCLLYFLVFYFYSLARRLIRCLESSPGRETVAMASIYLITTILYLSSILNAQNIGSVCILDNGLNGVCSSVSNCPEVAALIQDRKRPKVCEFIAEEPIVCCPQDGILKNDELQTKFARNECAIEKITPLKSYYQPDIAEQAKFKRADRLPTRMKRAKTLDLLNNPAINIHNIAGGVKSLKAEFPHMTRLGIGEDESKIEWYCGGTLISDKFILTAAHCIYSRFGTINWALLGDPESTLVQIHIKIINNIIHPNFNYSEHYHDIALSELNEKISFSRNIRPACLYLEREMEDDPLLVVSGWGSTEFGAEGSKDLLKATVSLYTYQECKKKYSGSLKKLSKGIVDDIQFCAGGRTEVKDTCQGDSGGPIQMNVRNTNFQRIYSIVGITSFGKICGFVNQPGVYTRLYPYIGWIESIVFNSTSG